MADIDDARLVAALKEILAERFVQNQNETVVIPGLGSFRLHHEVSQVQHAADGNVVMKPPKDVIAFVPEP